MSKMDNYNSHEINKEVKKVKIKKYKTLLNLIYRVFGGIIVKKHLEDICVKYKKYTTDMFNVVMDELEEISLIEYKYIEGSECSIVKLKQFVIDELEEKKSKGISYSEGKVTMSCFKYYYILNSPNLNNIGGDMNLDSLYNKLMTQTNFWNKENSSSELYKWILSNKIYGVTDTFNNFLKVAEAEESTRNERMKEINKERLDRNKENNKETNEESKNDNKKKKSKKSNKKDYTDKVNFGSLRNRDAFICTFDNNKKILELNTFVIMEDSPDFNSISKLIFDSIYLSTNHLETVRHLNFNLYFRDFSHMKSSFNSCFIYDIDERKIVTDKRVLVDKMAELSRKYIQTSFKPFYQNLDRDNYSIILKYKYDYAMSYVDGDNIREDKEIIVNINFNHFDLYKDLYGEEKAEAMKEISKVKTEKKRAEKADREEAIKFITKISKEGNMDTLLELSRLSKNRIEKLKALLDSL